MIDIHESCAQLVAAGYNAAVVNEEDDEFFATIRIRLDEQFDVLAIYQHGQTAADLGWNVYTVVRGDFDAQSVEDICIYENDDVCEAVLSYARRVGKDARADTGFCARHAVLEHFGWDA